MPHYVPIAVISLVLAANSSALAIRPWQQSTEFKEKSFTASADPDVRVHVNAPLENNGQPALGTRLIIFALPNGNTIEQTLGCKLVDGLDWHYDIQHVAAQVRLLRKLYPEERIVLVCVETQGLSWPNWRRTHEDANHKIAELVLCHSLIFGLAGGR